MLRESAGKAWDSEPYLESGGGTLGPGAKACGKTASILGSFEEESYAVRVKKQRDNKKQCAPYTSHTTHTHRGTQHRGTGMYMKLF